MARGGPPALLCRRSVAAPILKVHVDNSDENGDRNGSMSRQEFIDSVTPAK